MAIRTIQFLGLGFGEDPANITVTANGNQIFTGTVTTINQPLPSLPNFDYLSDQVVLFTYEIDTSFSGQIPMACTVDNGTVIFGQIFANYIRILNPGFTPEQLDYLKSPGALRQEAIAIYSSVATPPFTPEELAVLENPTTSPSEFQAILLAHNASVYISSGPDTYGELDPFDPRENIVIDTVPVVADHETYPGDWWWTIGPGSTLEYDLEVASFFN